MYYIPMYINEKQNLCSKETFRMSGHIICHKEDFFEKNISEKL